MVAKRYRLGFPTFIMGSRMHDIPYEVFPIVFRWEFYVDNVFLEGIIDLILFIILWSCFNNPCMSLVVLSGKVHNLAKIFLGKQCGFCSAEKIPEKQLTLMNVLLHGKESKQIHFGRCLGLRVEFLAPTSSKPLKMF